jgi:hypothetical protein
MCFDRARPRHDITHRSNTKIDKLNRNDAREME